MYKPNLLTTDPGRYAILHCAYFLLNISCPVDRKCISVGIGFCFHYHQTFSSFWNQQAFLNYNDIKTRNMLEINNM